MTVAQIDLITLCVWLGKWPIWFAWEMFLLKRRGERIMVRTLSQVAMRRSFQFTCVVYTEAYLLSHFVWTVAADVSHSRVKGIIGWSFVVAFMIYDALMWKTPRVEYAPAHRWARFPVFVAIFAILCGHFLFPQVGPAPWRWYNVSW